MSVSMSISPPVIRPASLADLRAIAEIYRPAVLEGTASFETEPPDEAEMGRRYAAIVENGLPYLVAEAEPGVVVGYAYASLFRPRPAYRFSVENSIYVAPDRKGGGIGRALLDELIARCTAHGLRQMIAVIGDSRNMSSIALHRRAGFTFIGTVHSVGFKHGRWLDTVYMQRALGDGDASTPV
jgi:phosphinothricin acetyltransferase